MVLAGYGFPYTKVIDTYDLVETCQVFDDSMKKITLLLIRLYQNTISRVLPPSCRFTPTCSHYGYEAVEKHGFFKGVWMAVKRVSRCHPLNPGGYDPVP